MIAAPLTEQFSELKADADATIRTAAVEAARSGILPQRQDLLAMLTAAGWTLERFETAVTTLQQRFDVVAKMADEIPPLEEQVPGLEFELKEAIGERRRVEEETERMLKAARANEAAARQTLEGVQGRISRIRDDAHKTLRDTADNRAIGQQINRIDERLFQLTRTMNWFNNPSPQFMALTGRPVIEQAEREFREANAERYSQAADNPYVARQLQAELQQALDAARMKVNGEWNRQIEAEKADLESWKSEILSSFHLDPMNCSL